MTKGRLTYMHEDGYGVLRDNIDPCEAITMLAEYEDTGLTPEKIRLNSLFKADYKYNDAPILSDEEYEIINKEYIKESENESIK